MPDSVCKRFNQLKREEKNRQKQRKKRKEKKA
jgi:hypothetical protein